MKRIVLAKRLYRILAGLIDYVILLGTSAILFLAWIYPVTFDRSAYETNNAAMVEKFNDSSLYLTTANGDYCSKSLLVDSYKSFSDLYNASLSFRGESFASNNLSKDLYLFYTTNYTTYGSSSNLTPDAYKNSILKLGNAESNIASFDESTYQMTLIDESKASKSITYFLKAYSVAAMEVENSNTIQQYVTANKKIMFSSLVLIVPVLVSTSVIFNLVIPLCSPCGESIGKWIFGLGILTKDGYEYPKVKLVLRWLVYIVVEVILGLITFGGVFLISYTMFMFVKKRRCLHDVIAGSVVFEKGTSIYFDNPQEEAVMKQRLGDLPHE